MTTYTTIPNGNIDQDSPVDQPLLTALRDNPIAIAEGDASVALGLLPTVLLGTLTLSGASTQTLSGLVLTPYKFLRLVLVGASAIGAANLLVAGQIVFVLGGGGDTVRGMVEIDLTDGTFASVLASAGGTASAVATVYAGDTATTTASTSVAVSISTSLFDSGSVRVYGVK